MFGRLHHSFTELLSVSLFGFGVSWFLALVLVALWTCYLSLCAFFDLALVFFVISLVSFDYKFARLKMRH